MFDFIEQGKNQFQHKIDEIQKILNNFKSGYYKNPYGFSIEVIDDNRIIIKSEISLTEKEENKLFSVLKDKIIVE